MPLPSLPDVQSGQHIAAPFPVRILFIEQLSLLIGKKVTSIRTCATSKDLKHLIPRPHKLPNSRRLCWYEHEVLAWIESNRPAEPPPPKRPRGRPTKAEQLVRQRWAATQASAR